MMTTDLSKHSLNVLLLAGACLDVQAGGTDLELVPCIKGGVSATGQYENQAVEDTANRDSDYSLILEDNSIGDG